MELDGILKALVYNYCRQISEEFNKAYAPQFTAKPFGMITTANQNYSVTRYNIKKFVCTRYTASNHLL